MSKKRTMNELRQTKDSVYNHPYDWKEEAIKQAATTMCEWFMKGCDCAPTEARKCFEENKEKIAQDKHYHYLSRKKQQDNEQS